MIAGVAGRLVSKSGDEIVIATPGGASYRVSVPLGVLERLPREGAEVALQTVLVVREDEWLLFGFDANGERDIFERLLTASGVGPRLALAMVSTLGGSRVARAIRDADLAALCTVPGVGKKKAERMVLELRDRLADVAAPGAPAAAASAEQAVQALINLGYGQPDADRAVRQYLAQNGTADPVNVIRGALQLLIRSK
jgi:Holliday junction DNA helicase RuvA